jgi:EmrB/QacA subfamily drug resistance transporter
MSAVTSDRAAAAPTVVVSPTAVAVGTAGGRRWAALVVLCAGMLMVMLDGTVVNVALPAIQNDLGFTSSDLAWVVNAYLTAFGGLLLLGGRLGDLTSRRGVFLAGLVLFTAASLLCGLATSKELLIAARFAQGVGGALTTAVALGMIAVLFPEPAQRAKAIGVYSFVATAGGSLGLLAGGVLTQGLGWHAIFFINVPVGVAALLFARRLLDRDRGAGIRQGSDILGAALITAALMLAIYTIVQPGAEYGWADVRTLALGGLTIVLLAGFVVREATAARPLVPLRIFRSRAVSGANVVRALTTAGMFSVFVLGTLYLQRVQGYGALRTGLAFLPLTVVLGCLSLRYTGRLVTRYGARRVMLPGLVLVAVGLGLLGRLPVHGRYAVDLLPALLLLGTGVGLSFPALTTLAMSDATRDDAGLTSGLLNTTNQVGAGAGLAVLSTVSAARTGGLARHGAATAEALTGGYRLAFLVACALVVTAIVVAAALLRRR